MDATAEARKLITDALTAIDEERGRLQRFLGHLDGRPGRSRRKTGERAPQARKRRQAPRGARLAEVLADIKAHPGTRTSETAKRIGIQPNYAHGLVGRLRKEGKVSKGKTLKATGRA